MYRGMPFVPDESSPRRVGPDRRRDRDEDEYSPGWVDPFDVEFANPIATGMEVLFGGLGAYGNRMDVSPDETGVSAAMAGSAPPFYGQRSYGPYDPAVEEPAEPVEEHPGQPVFDEYGGFLY